MRPFGTQPGELASCDIALALRRAQQRRERMAAMKRARVERRRAWFARLLNRRVEAREG